MKMRRYERQPRTHVGSFTGRYWARTESILVRFSPTCFSHACNIRLLCCIHEMRRGASYFTPSFSRSSERRRHVRKREFRKRCGRFNNPTHGNSDV